MSIVCTSPACALPGWIHSPGLAAWKVTVSAARTAAPRDDARGSVHAARHIDADDGRARVLDGAVDRGDRLGDGAARLTLKAGAEQRVDDRRRAGEHIRPRGWRTL